MTVVPESVPMASILRAPPVERVHPMPQRRIRHSADPSVDETFADGQDCRLRSVGHTQLGEHAAHVSLDGLLADTQPLRDLFVREPLDHKAEDVAFPGGEIRAVSTRRPAAMHQPSRHRRMQRRAPRMDVADAVGECPGIDVLEQVAGSPGCDRRKDLSVVGEAREHEHAGARDDLEEAADCADAVALRHDQVKEDDVGHRLRCDAHRCIGTRGLTHYLDALLEAQERAEPLANHRVVIDDHQADGRTRAHPVGTLTVTAVPPRPWLRMSSCAPISWARSRMVVSPIPRRVCGSAPGSNPGPSSRMRSVTALPPERNVTRTAAPAAWRIALWSASWAIRSSACSVSSGKRIPSSASTSTRAPLVRSASAWSASVAASPSRSRLLGRSAWTRPRNSWSAEVVRCSKPRIVSRASSSRVESAAALAARTRLNSVCVAASCNSRATRLRSSTTASRCERA